MIDFIMLVAVVGGVYQVRKFLNDPVAQDRAMKDMARKLNAYY